MKSPEYGDSLWRKCHMGTILNPKADNGSENLFLKLFNNRKNGAFADKTDFISETIDRLDSPRKLILFAKPPRFGKTVMAEMLACYYSKGADCKDVFSGLKVSGYAGTEGFRGRKRNITYEEHLNKRHVIYWDMNSILYRQNHYADNVPANADNFAIAS